MDGLSISALAALSGSVIGGLTALGGSWLRQVAEARAQEEAEDRTTREALYRDFIVEASRLYGDALMHDKAEMSEFIGLYAMISRMRVRSSAGIINHAEKIARNIVDTYLGPNRTFRDVQQMLERERIDPLREFSEACREELRPHRVYSHTAT